MNDIVKALQKQLAALRDIGEQDASKFRKLRRRLRSAIAIHKEKTGYEYQTDISVPGLPTPDEART